MTPEHPSPPTSNPTDSPPNVPVASDVRESRAAIHRSTTRFLSSVHRYIAVVDDVVDRVETVLLGRRRDAQDLAVAQTSSSSSVLLRSLEEKHEFLRRLDWCAQVLAAVEKEGRDDVLADKKADVDGAWLRLHDLFWGERDRHLRDRFVQLCAAVEDRVAVVAEWRVRVAETVVHVRDVLVGEDGGGGGDQMREGEEKEEEG